MVVTPGARLRGDPRAQTRASRRVGAVLGVASSGAGLGVSELLSAIFHQRVSPLIAVAEVILRLTPGAVAEKIIHLVGHKDKPLLITSTLIGLIVLSALAGVLAVRAVGIGVGIFAVMGVAVVMSVHARLTPSGSTYIPAVTGIVTSIVVLVWLSGYAVRASHEVGQVEDRAPDEADLAPRSRRPEPARIEQGRPDAPESSRRSFLQRAGIVAALAVVTGVTGRVIARGRAAVDAARNGLRLPVTVPRVPNGVSVGIAGVAPWETSLYDFYRVDTALVVPQLLPDSWHLRVHGMVDREIELSFQDLMKYPITEGWITMCCVSNEVGGHLISNAWFSGVKIAEVLADAGVQSGADAIKSTSSDGWTAGTPLSVVLDGRNALFAVAMNGEPLPLEHGFPVRMVVPGLYGYVSGTKWVVDVEVTRFDDFQAFWSTRGWSEQGPVKTESRIDVPHNNAQVSAGRVAVGGVAWAQHTGIAKVEVSVDDGEWQEARLGSDPTTDSWRQWAYAWDAVKGDHKLAVRATDDSGYVQTDYVSPPPPNGATGWHTISVSVS